MKNVLLYTDGACSENPGVGGWGAVLFYKDIKKELSGYEENTTNNRMELLAVINGIKALKEPCNISVYSDSAYTVNAFKQNWINNWQLKNWRTANNKAVKNVDLWQELLALVSIHKITWHKVKGHSDNEYNNRCDFLATNEIAKFKESKKNAVKKI